MDKISSINIIHSSTRDYKETLQRCEKTLEENDSERFFPGRSNAELLQRKEGRRNRNVKSECERLARELAVMRKAEETASGEKEEVEGVMRCAAAAVSCV